MEKLVSLSGLQKFANLLKAWFIAKLEAANEAIGVELAKKVNDAESNGKQYVRQNGSWVELVKGETITVDSELSSDSENPVQNKVVKSSVEVVAASVLAETTRATAAEKELKDSIDSFSVDAATEDEVASMFNEVFE